MYFDPHTSQLDAWGHSRKRGGGGGGKENETGKRSGKSIVKQGIVDYV